MIWEYKKLVAPDLTEQELNELGEKRWDLVAVIDFPTQYRSDVHRKWIFKRGIL